MFLDFKKNVNTLDMIDYLSVFFFSMIGYISIIIYYKSKKQDDNDFLNQEYDDI